MADAPEFSLAAFNQAISPLLRLVQHLTEFETAFVTEVDLSARQQRVIIAENSGTLQLSSGTEVDWSNSMCNLMFSEKLTSTHQLKEIFPDSNGVALGMQSFVVLPIKLNNITIGTLCGADTKPKHLNASQHVSLQYIADAMSVQLHAFMEVQQQRELANQANHKINFLKSKVDLLAQQANTDSLTNLLNRRGFQIRCDEASSLCARSGLRMAIMLIDIDNFKQYNDQHGHKQGDDIIRLVAEGMRQVTRSTDIICRLGGDEFILAAIDTDIAGMTVLAERLVNYMRQQSQHLAQPCTLSIGIASNLNLSIQQLTQHADQALYQSKAAGRNTISIFSN